ncbi:uncharacterized protein LOC116267602 [Nymphaea colorata]|uniref:uncharacterized protein LOC116267602 n=1 Tax=Nymphaea colorata TaxID=210225 RepID=UPI00129ED893|nr:uncharacterized protein LOC116267602 [Nymphaea colorata]XP_049931200.1 uncharacterized protein LOC116267602 [Nymphaea colorata]
MLSLWKKKKAGEKKGPRGKIHKISRLVSDLNSKRESLVQTGFPTSVADLVVNSRINWIPPINERKKPSKKSSNPSIKDIRPPFLNPPAIHIPTPVVELEPTNHSHLESGPVQPQIQKQLINKRLSPTGETDEDPLLLKRFKVVSLICLLSVLAFVTKKVTLGITILAFCLLLAEYLKNNFCHPSKLSTCSAGVLKSKSEGSSHRGITAFEEVDVHHYETGFCESERDERVTLIHNEEILAYNPPSEHWSVNKGRHFQESGRDEPIAVKQDSIAPVEALAGNQTWKVKLKSGIKAKVLRRFFSKPRRSSRNGSVEEVAPKADGLPGSEFVQEAEMVKEKKQLSSEEKDLLFPTENDLPFISEKSSIKGSLCIVYNLSLENMIFVGVILSSLVGGRLVALVITTSWYLVVKCRQQGVLLKQE